MSSFLSRLMTPFDAEPDDQPFTPDEVAALRAAVPLDAGDVVDDATWRDLLLPRYTDGFAAGTSIFGRQVLERSRGERAVICLVDEIFRGTNHEESVSAAAAVVDELARHALVVVSSHNLVLGSLLAHALAPWRIVRGGDGALVVEPGVLGRTNGVALLAEHGFDETVQRRAEQVAAWLAQQRHRDAGMDALT